MSENELFIPFAKNNKSAERLSGSNCIIYTRVSSKEQEEGYSLETQRKAIELHAQKNNLYIIAYFGGTYESAKNDERKEFTRMLTFARRSKEKISYILVYSVDRFSRSGANAVYIASELRKENIKIFAVTQPSDTATPSGKLQQNIQFIFSEYDNDLRREKCVAGMKEKLMKGYWTQKAPLGYDQYTKHREQHITVNETGEILRKAFYWKVENMTNVEILERLKAAGVKVSIQQITEIFRNPFYCGMIRHNLLPGKIIEGKHEKLISKEIFLSINGVRTRQGIKFNKEFPKTPLKHFLRCKDCGTPFTGYEVKKKGLHYYKCNKKGCKSNRNANTLHGKFMEVMMDFKVPKRHNAPIKDELMSYMTKVADDNQGNEKLFKAQLTEVNKKIEMLEERYILGEISRDLYVKFIEKYRIEKSVIEENIAKCTVDLSNLENEIDLYLLICGCLPAIWQEASYQRKLEIQEMVFPEGIMYDREIDHYRTTKINSVVLAISQLSRDLEGVEKGKTACVSGFSNVVGPLGIEPSTHRL